MRVANSPAIEVGAAGGIFSPSVVHELYDPATVVHQPYALIGPEFGLRAGIFPKPFFGIEGELYISPTKSRTSLEPATLMGMRLHVQARLPYRVSPFLLAGGGGLAVNSAVQGNDQDWQFHWGGGLLFMPARALVIRIEGRQLLGARGGTSRPKPADHLELLLGISGRFDLKPDADGDGLVRAFDDCPTIPEDIDGYRDSDGCPDEDNDSDGILDVDDGCPDVPEDPDGFEDHDGCPDDDNDNDGIVDAEDGCPNEPESRNGIEDSDGCPEPDTDGDLFVDPVDECPDEPEDVDGYYDNDGCPEPDNDGDGILDPDDECPNAAETFDGIQDEDGCPEGDDDRDGLVNPVDRCVDDPEDHDGFEDQDGCPDPDNDQDGVADVDDACPMVPETINDVEDEDGCPEFDTDGDGLLDPIDHCPTIAEDMDGFDDDDGCPDPDNDMDGILDADDQCPNEAEVYNAVEDEDGCPDEALVVIKQTSIDILERVYFDVNKATLKPESYTVLDAVATVLSSYPNLSLIEIQGHTDSDGSNSFNLRLSQQRAESVRDYLVSRGVDIGRLLPRGYGEERPIVENDTDEGKATNRRVEFIILERSN